MATNGTPENPETSETPETLETNEQAEIQPEQRSIGGFNITGKTLLIGGIGGGGVLIIAVVVDEDFEENTYRGYEIWEDSGGAAALFEGYVVISHNSVRAVERILKNLYNETGSLARTDSDNELKLILDKVGDGFMVVATTEECAVERCEGLGINFHDFDLDAEEGMSKIVLLFRNERSAERAADDYDEVADFLEREWDTDIDDTEADGRFVTGENTFDLFDDNSSRSGGNPVARPQAAAPTVPPAAVGATATHLPMVAQQADSDNFEDAFFAECRREMASELGIATRRFCECIWNGIGDLGVNRSERLQVVERYVEGESPQVDLVVENCAFNALLGS